MPQITTVGQLRAVLGVYSDDTELILIEPEGPSNTAPVFRIHDHEMIHVERELDHQPENAPAKDHLVFDIVHVSSTTKFHDPNGASIHWPGK